MDRTLRNHVVVITGASSGIGRATALQFGRSGASVVLASRNTAALEDVAGLVEQAGGQAAVVVTDVSGWEQVQRLAQTAIERFGRIDTWVNNAAVTVYGTFEQLTVEEIERVIQVNLMGQIYGMKVALPYMKAQHGGTIINVASVEAERAVPLQTPYTASKHAIKGFTEALRLELKHDKIPVNLTLILPASINTPLFDHARSKLGSRPSPIPPVYEPEVVAKAIVFAAQHPRRDIYVGSVGKFLAIMEHLSPALTDRMMLAGGMMFRMQKSGQPDDGQDNLFAPMPGSAAVESNWPAFASSPYTRYFEFHPNLKRLALVTTLAGLVGLILRRRA